MLSRQALLRPARVINTQARTYAAAAASSKVKAPVALFGVDGTYATALVRPSRPESRRHGQLISPRAPVLMGLRRLKLSPP